jgi:hypothetical protein
MLNSSFLVFQIPKYKKLQLNKVWLIDKKIKQRAAFPEYPSA